MPGPPASDERAPVGSPTTIPAPQQSHHHRVGSLVGSMGRQGFQMPLSKRDREHARSLLFSDQLDTQTTGDAQHAVEHAVDHSEALEDDDGALLEEGVGAPSEARRVHTEQRNLLRESGQLPDEPGQVHSSYGATLGPHASSHSRQSHASDPGWDYPGWDDALARGKIETSIGLELRTLVANSLPLAVTFILQYSLIMASLFSVGHLGKVELGAVSLGGMTASITGTAFIQGMSTCLDTLCSQAYGAGRPDLVGLYFQKGVLVVMLGLLPVLLLWYRADAFLPYIVNESEADSERLVELATRYLRIMILAMPGYCLFECGKRFMQAQGIFTASTYVLIVCAPLNILITYALVWHPSIGLGFIGAPISVAITNTLLALFLLAYVLFVDGKKCWNGFTWKVLENWGPLVQLAIPGLVMVESEFLAYEIMTLASSYLGTNELAVQTILSSMTSLAYEAPFAFGCAGATRVAGFIGAGLPAAAKLAVSVTVAVGCIVGFTDASIIFFLRHTFASMFSSDPEVLHQAVKYFPLCVFMHLLDALGAVCGGILRGQGRQSAGGYINLVSYYVVGVPASLFLCFGPWKLGLVGIWFGFILAIFSVVTASLVALRLTNWSKLVRKAQENT